MLKFGETFLIFVLAASAATVQTDEQTVRSVDDQCDGKFPLCLPQDGRDGIPGRDGRDGRDGKDGRDCKNTAVLVHILNELQQRVKLLEQENRNITTFLNQVTVTLNDFLKREKTFVKLQDDKKLSQSILPGGYDKINSSILQWQSLHVAAAAACRGSTATGGSGPYANVVVANPVGESCTTTCLKTVVYTTCDAQISLRGTAVKARDSNSNVVGSYYNYQCDANNVYSISEMSRSDDDLNNSSHSYFSYCCCRKP